MKKWLFNPFTYIAGFKSFLLGWAIMLLTAVIAYYTTTHFDGVIDAHTGLATPSWYYVAEPLINWICLTVIFYLTGKFFSASDIRLIDVAGTLALARAPLLPIALAGGMIKPQTPSASLTTLQYDIILIDLVMTIWLVALYYNAFRVSCNFKGGRATGFFIAGLIIAEILSKVIFYFLYKPLL